MMALAIAHHIRDQVIFFEEPIVVNPQYHFSVESMNEAVHDYGSEMTVI